MTRAEDDVAAFGRLDRIVLRAVKDGQVSGVVAGIARTNNAHVVTAGVAEFGGAPMRRSTQFRISSMTKPLTAAATLSLIDAGLLDLNGLIDEFLPELADRRVLRNPDGPLHDTVPARRPITVRDLLTFISGFGMQGRGSDGCTTTVVASSRPATRRTVSGPGRRHSPTAPTGSCPPLTTSSLSAGCCYGEGIRCSHPRQ